MAPETLLNVEHLDLVFGHQPELAFKSLDNKQGREIIKQETGQIVAVHNATFSVKRGEILVFMGLSGSGKSSLLRCLNGMNGRAKEIQDDRDPGKARGQIIFNGASDGSQESKTSPTTIDLLKCSDDHLRNFRRNHISMVFQQFGLMPWKTVRDNVAFPLILKKLSKAEINQAVDEKIELVGLTNWSERYPHELSGGMKQRVGLARAFVTQSDILLMDEPFSALDPYHRGRLQDEVLSLQKQLKKTIIFVSHDPDEALKIADRIAVMDAGVILQIDTPENCKSNPSCEAVKRIISL